MLHKSFLLLLLVACSFTQAQKRIQISGLATAENAANTKISVVNYQTKVVVHPNSNGQFRIDARQDDLLIFMLDNYIDQQAFVDEGALKNKLKIRLKPKAVEFQEVAIEQKPLQGKLVTATDIGNVKLEKQQSRPVNTAVYTGEIVNGLDLVAITKEVAGRVKRDAEKAKTPVAFKDYVASHFDPEYFTKTLKLQPEQVTAFLDYCNDDPKAAILAQDENALPVSDFLIAKAAAFKKLK